MNIQKRTSSSYSLGLQGILYLLLGTHVACGGGSSSPNSNPAVKTTNITYTINLTDDKKVKTAGDKIYYKVPVGTPVNIIATPDPEDAGKKASAVWVSTSKKGSPGTRTGSDNKYFPTWTYTASRPETIKVRLTKITLSDSGVTKVNLNQQWCEIKWVNQRQVEITLQDPTIGPKDGKLEVKGTLHVENFGFEGLDEKLSYEYKVVAKSDGETVVEPKKVDLGKITLAAGESRTQNIELVISEDEAKPKRSDEDFLNAMKVTLKGCRLVFQVLNSKNEVIDEKEVGFPWD